MKKDSIFKIVLAGLFTAIGLVLPIIFHAVSLSGSIFLPMHIPVLLCGLICGYSYGAICGVLVVLLSSVLTGMPPIYPVAVYMAFELLTYGLVAGLTVRKTNPIVALIVAMLCGRVVLAIAQIIIFSATGKSFVIGAFFTGAFITALPGIIAQLIIIPIIMISIRKYKPSILEIV